MALRIPLRFIPEAVKKALHATSPEPAPSHLRIVTQLLAGQHEAAKGPRPRALAPQAVEGRAAGRTVVAARRGARELLLSLSCGPVDGGGHFAIGLSAPSRPGSELAALLLLLLASALDARADATQRAAARNSHRLPGRAALPCRRLGIRLRCRLVCAPFVLFVCVGKGLENGAQLLARAHRLATRLVTCTSLTGPCSATGVARFLSLLHGQLARGLVTVIVSRHVVHLLVLAPPFYCPLVALLSSSRRVVFLYAAQVMAGRDQKEMLHDWKAF